MQLQVFKSLFYQIQKKILRYSIRTVTEIQIIKIYYEKISLIFLLNEHIQCQIIHTITPMILHLALCVCIYIYIYIYKIFKISNL